MKIYGNAVTEAIRLAHARNDLPQMRAICGNTPDNVLLEIGDGTLEARGCSETEFIITRLDGTRV